MKKYVSFENGVVKNVNEGKALEINVSYDLGGYNRSRGIKLSIYPCSISEPLGGFRSISMSLFDKANKRYVCEELARKSAKKIAKWDAFVEENLPRILTAYTNGNDSEVFSIIRECA